MDKNLIDTNVKILPIFFILIFALFLRCQSFILPHMNFDELAYLSLALKLDKFGFKNFDKTFDLHHIELKDNENFIAPTFSDKDVGNFLIGSQVEYEYRSPTHRPPAFSYLLMLSHRIFLSDSHYLVSRRYFNPYALALQFYACVVPLFFSLAFIFVTYLLGRLLFSEKIGIYAALFITLSPTELFTSQMIWAESMVSFFTILTVIFYFLSIKKNNLIYACLAGISVGVGVLTKLTGGFIIIVILLYHLWHSRFLFKKLKTIPKIIFEPKIIIFLLTFICVAGRWLYTYKTYIGTSLPTGPCTLTWWLSFIGSRPWYTYLVNIPCQFPVYFLFLGTLVLLFTSKEQMNSLVFLILWFLVTLIILIFGVWFKEDRYMLPCYPAIAIASAYVMTSFANFFNRKFGYCFGDIIAGILIIFSGTWALILSISAVMSRIEIISFPL